MLAPMAGFSAVNLPRAGGDPDLLGLWQIVPGPFDPPGAKEAMPSGSLPQPRHPRAGADALRWRVDLQRAPTRARADLARGRDLQADSRRVLEQAGVALTAYAH